MSEEKKEINENDEKEELVEGDEESLDEGIGFDEKIEAAMEKIVQSALNDSEEEQRRKTSGQKDTASTDSSEEDDEDEHTFLKEYQESLRAAKRAAKASESQEKDKAKTQAVPEQTSKAPSSNKKPGDNAGESGQASKGKKGKNQKDQTVRSARPQQIGYIPVHENAASDPEEDQPERKKSFKGLKVSGMVAAMMLAAAGTAYAGVSYYYTDKFFNGTFINGIDVSGMTAYEAEQALARKVSDYSIEVGSRNLAPQVISGSTINYRYISDGSILNFLKSQKPYEWIQSYFDRQTFYTATVNAAYDKELLKTQVKELACAQPENQVEPENAYVAYTDTQFEIIPETDGSTLDIKNAYKVLDEAIAEGDSSIDFSTEPSAYVQAEITSDSDKLKSLVDACNNYTKSSITYTFGDQSKTLDGSIIKDWLQFDDKNQLIQDDATFQQHVADYVAQVAAEFDTVGTEREFYTTSGRVVYVYGSNYGWKIDQATEVARLTEEVRSGTTVTREPAYLMTANAHGINDFGDTYIEVDMGDQHMYYYQNGSIIFDSDFVSGDINYSDRATPSGIYTLYYKTSPATLKGQINPETGEPEYETDVTFWMPFNGGIGFHDADWQPYFGGDRFTYGGSHGCINLPYYAAAELYDIIQYDVPIICFY